MTGCKLPPNYYAYVEGDMERNALKKRLGIKARKIGINGNMVQMSAIARNLSTDLMSFPKDSRVVIVFDRETRSQSCEELASNLMDLLKCDFPEMEFCIGIPDRDMESWLFADRDLISKHFKKRVGRRARFEGEVGVHAVKKHIGTGCYDKMTDGVAILMKSNWATISANSASARRFPIKHFIPGCDWLS